jgi:nucleoside phosphorylase
MQTSSRMKPVLVCFALKEEAGAFRRLVKKQADIQILVTGIGQENARSAICPLLKNCSPRFALTCGFAGALNSQLAIGEVLFATDEAGLLEKLSRSGARPARFHCSSRVAVTAAEKAELRSTTGADVVEMESGVIQIICRERGIPCATVRVVSDTANEDLPLDFNQLSKPDASLDFGKLALAVAKSPGKLSSLLRLQKNCRFAAGRLAEVLAKVTGVAHVP